MSYVVYRMSVLCQINCVGGITWCTFSMDEKKAEKKRSLRNEKLKANRTSETEEQRKERLRIRRKKDRARRRTKGKKRSPDTDDYEKQRLATLKRLKRGEVDLRLEKVVASKQLG